jgi:hypothetical protein
VRVFHGAQSSRGLGIACHLSGLTVAVGIQDQLS